MRVCACGCVVCTCVCVCASVKQVFSLGMCVRVCVCVCVNHVNYLEPEYVCVCACVFKDPIVLLNSDCQHPAIFPRGSLGERPLDAPLLGPPD